MRAPARKRAPQKDVAGYAQDLQRRWRRPYVARSNAEYSGAARKRMRWIALAFVLAAVAVMVKLVALQGDAERYDELAADQHERSRELPADRGRILDRRGHPLAISRELQSVFANPREMQDAGVAADAAIRLAEVLDVDVAVLQERFAADKGFVWVDRKVADDVARQVEALDIEGLYMTPEADREYPSGALAGSVIGFTDIDNEGLAGIEKSFDDELRGKPGELIFEKDPAGLTIPAGKYRSTPAQPGADVRLTLDSAIQFEAEATIADAVNRFDAKSGVVAVMDPKTGDVLAFANYPSFDPNDPSASTPEARSPWGVGNVFEPGSTSKVITISAALEDGLVTADTYQNVPDHIRIYDRTFGDSYSHGDEWWSIRDVIVKSSNVGTIQVARRLGDERFDFWLRRYGYGRPTGIELPSESSGITRDVSDWSGTDFAALAIGQSVAATPLQMLRVFGVIANDGMMVEPRLVADVSDNGGDESNVAGVDRPDSARVISPETAATMRDMLRGVVSEEGTAPLAAVPGYSVAGKTGTAQKLAESGSGYAEDRYIASFVGFAPVHDPRAVTIVVLDEPTPSYGGLSAAPTFSRMMGFVLRALRVPPDDDATAQPEEPA